MRISREQGQRMLAGALGGLILAALFWVFVLQPMRDRAATLDRQIADQQSVLDDLSRLMRDERQTGERYDAARAALREVMARQLPPDGNPMAWASEAVRRATAAAGIPEENRALSEASSGTVALSGLSSRISKAPLLAMYEVRIDLLCGYHRLGFFLANLEREMPFMLVRSLSIQGGTDNATQHKVTMKCAFPRFTREGFPPESRPDADLPEVKKARGRADQGGDPKSEAP